MPPLSEGTLILNTAAPLTHKIKALATDDEARALLLASHVTRLALLSCRKLTATEMQALLSESYAILTELAK